MIWHARAGDRWDGLFSYVRLEERIPADHPLRPIRALADEALAALNGRFEARSFRLDPPRRSGSRSGSPSIMSDKVLGRKR